MARLDQARQQLAESRQVENAISLFLRGALAAIVAVGLAATVFYLVQEGSRPVTFAVFEPLPPGLRSPAGIVSGAAAGSPAELVQFAVLLLLLTPLARESLAVVLLARRREWAFAAIGLAALLVMAYGLLPGS